MAQNGIYLCDNTGDSASGFGLGSGDLCIPFQQPDGTWGYVFGDCFVGQEATGVYIGSPVMVSQQTFDGSGATPIGFTGSQPQPTCAQLFTYLHKADNGFGYEVSRIPNDAITLTVGGQSRMFIQYTSVNKWVTPPGSATDGSLMAGVAYSDDGGSTWQDFDYHWPGSAQGNNGSLDMMWSFAGVDPDGKLYVFAKAWNGSHFYTADAGRIQLFRYDPVDFFNGRMQTRENWTFTGGAWQWASAGAAAPSSIFGPGNNIGEFSVKRIADTYVMSYFDVSDSSIRTRTAPRPDAVWSAPRRQVVGNQMWPPSHWFVPQLTDLYGGYIHPGSPSTSTMTLIISAWNGVPGHRPYTATQWSDLSV
ncbi:DUF4185 domain-containing protein [Nocardia sp. NPDC051570]|uniref:DUF4185 domain-containing protein n=1 Tax=Nocardia sp. NPDC051570 TaxID=3364324 RepID=UPI00379BF53A